jgi:hypothetical protein
VPVLKGNTLALCSYNEKDDTLGWMLEEINSGHVIKTRIDTDAALLSGIVVDLTKVDGCAGTGFERLTSLARFVTLLCFGFGCDSVLYFMYPHF